MANPTGAAAENVAALVKPQSRAIKPLTRLFLFVRAGGRCEFDGCNQCLLEHHVTKNDGVFAEMAHIWAFSEGGPRAQEPGRPSDVHDASNLMLLCKPCHKYVDDRWKEYSVDVLRRHKRAHEHRVFELTGMHPNRRTVAVVLKAKVGGRIIDVSRDEMTHAVAPNYVGMRDVVEVDLTTIADSANDAYWDVCSAQIKRKLSDLYERDFDDKGPARHVSVFAIAPIPLLVVLGTYISDKVEARLFQRHRDTEKWKWKETGTAVAYETRVLRTGSDPTAVALMLSLSGKVHEVDLPAKIVERFTIYELTLLGTAPTPTFLDTEESLQAFRVRFMATMREMVANHPALERVHVFPAVPAPVAVTIGRDLMFKRDPTLLVYDYDNRAGRKFVSTIEVKPNESR